MSRHTRTALTLLVVAVLFGAHARANIAKWWHEGEGYGPLVPQSDSDVRVDSEDLSFEVAPSLDRADVTATYRMTNGGAAKTDAELAFVLVAHEAKESEGAVPHAAITIDGAPALFRVVTDADVLGPALDGWLLAHPEIDKELARLTAPSVNPRYSDYDELRRMLVECRGECDELLRWYRQKKSPSKYDTAASRSATIVAAAEIAIPDAATKLQTGWSKLSQHRRLAWLSFQLAIEPGATRTVSVRYEHVAGDDTSRAVNQTFTYDYLLSPAKRWARFGQLHLAIHMPKGAQLHASLPLARDGDTYRSDFTTLPEGELSFETMSTSGLLFGMTQPGGYWALLIGVLSIVMLGTSMRLGRVWARASSRGGVVLRCIFGTGALVGVADGFVAWGLGAAFPARALGFGYGAGLGLIFLLVVLVVVGMAISGVSAARCRARSR